MNKLKVGFIGVGGIAQSRHIPAFKQLDHLVDIVGVFDINQEQSSQVASTFNIPNVYDTYQQVFNDVDAVVICTPNKFHAEMSVAALNAGIHVFCEKPMAMNQEECDKMIEAANTSGKLLAIGYHYRFTDAAILANRAIDDDVVGDPLVTRVRALRRRKVPGWGVFTNKELQGGGSLIDYGCHLLDLAMWLLKDRQPVEVLGKTYNRLSKTPGQINDWGTFNHETFEVDDHVSTFITFDDGSTMQFECSWSANIKEDQIHLSISGVGGGLNVYPFEIYQSKMGTFFNEQADAEHNEDVAAQRQTLNFVNSCLGNETLVVQPEQARQVSTLIDAIYRSSEEGRSVRL
ncbi:Gfo/Idh/MocA family oxidoreductase [Mammaliicoccus sp. Dog046]|uniref:Gfo/Idh/MocA family protein n=1 Tax=Mammaliicoccus sp. Dog046 TaxID=3034233 RepID=UPI002B264364|nr:Gfo/Idh/MocA family oxidoreductase [Mammaliicoccus sp. Dog046]WQK85675.1 Gfo/Idh/MocA family oxidoreductase [Mammaliicoccus sp. Dog046]